MSWNASTLCSDSDVISFRSDICSLGLTSCTSSIFDAKREIEDQLRLSDYNPDELIAEDFTKLREPAIFLALAYQYDRLVTNSMGPFGATLQADAAVDAFEKQSRKWRDYYGKRITTVMATGLTQSDISTFQSMGGVRILR